MEVRPVNQNPAQGQQEPQVRQQQIGVMRYRKVQNLTTATAAGLSIMCYSMLAEKTFTGRYNTLRGIAIGTTTTALTYGALHLAGDRVRTINRENMAALNPLVLGAIISGYTAVKASSNTPGERIMVMTAFSSLIATLGLLYFSFHSQ